MESCSISIRIRLSDAKRRNCILLCVNHDIVTETSKCSLKLTFNGFVVFGIVKHAYQGISDPTAYDCGGI